jgi:hypothetical protein
MRSREDCIRDGRNDCDGGDTEEREKVIAGIHRGRSQDRKPRKASSVRIDIVDTTNDGCISRWLLTFHPAIVPVLQDRSTVAEALDD